MVDQNRTPHEEDSQHPESPSAPSPLERLFPQRDDAAGPPVPEAPATESTVAPDVGAPSAPEPLHTSAHSEWFARTQHDVSPDYPPETPQAEIVPLSLTPETAPDAAATRTPASAQPDAGSSADSSSQPASARQSILLTPATGVAPVIYEVPTQRSAPAAAQLSGVRVHTIRCRQCGGTASSELTLCPHCGRELHAAPSRWLTIGMPAILGIILISLIAMQGSDGPAGWIGNRVRGAATWVRELSASLDPQIAIVPSTDSAATTLQGSGAQVALAAQPATTAAEQDSFDFEGVSDANLLGSEELLDAEGNVIAAGTAPTADTNAGALPAADATIAPEATQEVASLLPTMTITVSAVVLPLPLDTATLLPTDTPVPATATSVPVPTSGPAVYTVVTGDTALAIALRNEIDLDELIAYNGWTAQEAAMLQPGQQILLPPNAAGASIEGAPLPVGAVTYIVRQNDTLVDIARLHDVTVTGLMTVNNLTQGDVLSMRPGQVLIIPVPTVAPTDTPTDAPIATATATPVAPIAVATALSTQPASAATLSSAPAGLRVTAPRLRAPLSGVSIRCTTAGRLQWLASANILPDDSYRVHLGFVSGRDDGGNPRVTWLVEQTIPSTQTQMALDNTLCGTAPDAEGNQWRWYVEVVGDVNGVTVPVSTPSDVWGFAWD